MLLAYLCAFRRRRTSRKSASSARPKGKGALILTMQREAVAREGTVRARWTMTVTSRCQVGNRCACPGMHPARWPDAPSTRPPTPEPWWHPGPTPPPSFMPRSTWLKQACTYAWAALAASCVGHVRGLHWWLALMHGLHWWLHAWSACAAFLVGLARDKSFLCTALLDLLALPELPCMRCPPKQGLWSPLCTR